MITTFKEFIKTEFDIEMPKGEIPMDWFEENKLPMLVECADCGTTMASPAALVEKTDDRAYFVCEHCAEQLTRAPTRGLWF